MNPKTMKEEVEAIDRKVLSYCAEVEEALAPVLDIKIDAPAQKSPHYIVPDGMDLPREVRRQVERAKNLAWAIQRLPYLDLSFMNAMKKETFTILSRREGEKEVVLAVPRWVVGTYPSWTGNKAYFDAKAKAYDGLMGPKIEIPREVVAQNEKAIGDEWLNLEALIPEVPAALRRRIDPFLPRFDCVGIVAEAEWHALPGVDPLVVGVIMSGPVRHSFLLGEYDPTKLEKYIVAELAVKPKE